MSSPKKGNKKKTGNASVSETGVSNSFDYAALIPRNIDERSKQMVKKFLCNELVSDADREEALMVFAQALIAEHGGNVDVGEEELEQKTVMPQPTEPTEAELATAAEADRAIAEALKPLQKQAEQTSPQKSSINFEPNPACLTEERSRINVGWMAGPSDAQSEYDKKIALYSQRLGCQLYNFVSYPIGGAKRGFWRPNNSSDVPPPIDLPDLQLQNHLWETYVNGELSSWIDCDSPAEWLARLSEQEIEKELNYVTYLGLRSVVVPLKRASSPRLAAILNRWMWTKNINLTFWVFVPSDAATLIREKNNNRDAWEVWADFRTACCNFSSSKLIAGLRLTPDIDDEFIDKKLLDRWKGEPLAVFWVDSDVFVSDSRTSKAVLPGAHSRVLQELWMSDSARMIVRGPDDRAIPDDELVQMASALRECVASLSKKQRGITDTGFLADGNIDYMDVLQAPLQPLSDNLDSHVYNTFEQDPIKYRRYREAIEAALYDLAEKKDSLVLYVLGAGRGPLVSASLEAERNYNEKHRTRHNKFKLKVVVVEKNVNAVVTLKFCNEKGWKNRCQIVESDMRKLPERVEELDLPQPDIIVSELLGSFGDNELSPECLDGVTDILKPTTISIPQTYSSFVAPVQSIHMWQSIIGGGASYWNSGIPGHGRRGTEQQDDGRWKQSYPQGQQVANLDQIYVVFIRQFCALSEPKKVFTFNHPNFEKLSNERTTKIPFTIDRTSDIMGFTGYFHMNLYKDVTLSIVPETYSKGMISWFPALIPLRQLHRVKEGEEIYFCIDRKIDEKGVWYEWFIEYMDDGKTKSTTRQNVNGESYYMRLS